MRRAVETFRRESSQASRYCHSRARSRHGGPLEVHHVGGIKPPGVVQRLAWMCRKHNREDARMEEDPSFNLLGVRAVVVAAVATGAVLLARGA